MPIHDPLLGFIIVFLVVGVMTSVILYFSFIYKTPVDFFADFFATIRKKMQKSLNSSDEEDDSANKMSS